MSYEWAVIGAGPAGIAAVAKLLDEGILAEKIAWIDPKFKVGDFGQLWCNLPSNTRVALFLQFLNAIPIFGACTKGKNYPLDSSDPTQTCQLGLMAEPLQDITHHLKSLVHAVIDTAQALHLQGRTWHIELQNSNNFQAEKVILATGAEPKQLSHGLPVIPLQDAMDADKIKPKLQKNDTVAVFGSSHSAILVLQNLVNNKVTRIVNFFRSPLRYAVHLEDWILFDDSGLKGQTADWARENIDGHQPHNLERYYSNEENIEQHLPQCTKAVYAIGFEPRHLPVIKNLGPIHYDPRSGIIAPGLFGLGIAYPEARENRLGMTEYRVGLWKFMQYLHEILPIWMRYKT